MTPAAKQNIIITVLILAYVFGGFLSYGYTKANTHKAERSVVVGVFWPAYWPLRWVYLGVSAMADASESLFDENKN